MKMFGNKVHRGANNLFTMKHQHIFNFKSVTLEGIRLSREIKVAPCLVNVQPFGGETGLTSLAHSMKIKTYFILYQQISFRNCMI